MKTWSPKFMLPQSRLQIGGVSASMCSSRSTAPTKSVPGPATSGSGSPSVKSPPMPVVRFRMTSTPLSATRCITSR